MVSGPAMQHGFYQAGRPKTSLDLQEPPGSCCTTHSASQAKGTGEPDPGICPQRREKQRERGVHIRELKR